MTVELISVIACEWQTRPGGARWPVRRCYSGNTNITA
jgi:hypothetical protein